MDVEAVEPGGKLVLGYCQVVHCHFFICLFLMLNTLFLFISFFLGFSFGGVSLLVVVWLILVGWKVGKRDESGCLLCECMLVRLTRRRRKK